MRKTLKKVLEDAGRDVGTRTEDYLSYFADKEVSDIPSKGEIRKEISRYPPPDDLKGLLAIQGEMKDFEDGSKKEKLEKAVASLVIEACDPEYECSFLSDILRLKTETGGFVKAVSGLLRGDSPDLENPKLVSKFGPRMYADHEAQLVENSKDPRLVLACLTGHIADHNGAAGIKINDEKAEKIEEISENYLETHLGVEIEDFDEEHIEQVVY